VNTVGSGCHGDIESIIDEEERPGPLNDGGQNTSRLGQRASPG
jgi:hypothetical protein